MFRYRQFGDPFGAPFKRRRCRKSTRPRRARSCRAGDRSCRQFTDFFSEAFRPSTSQSAAPPPAPLRYAARPAAAACRTPHSARSDRQQPPLAPPMRLPFPRRSLPLRSRAVAPKPSYAPARRAEADGRLDAEGGAAGRRRPGRDRRRHRHAFRRAHRHPAAASTAMRDPRPGPARLAADDPGLSRRWRGSAPPRRAGCSALLRRRACVESLRSAKARTLAKTGRAPAGARTAPGARSPTPGAARRGKAARPPRRRPQSAEGRISPRRKPPSVGENHDRGSESRRQHARRPAQGGASRRRAKTASHRGHQSGKTRRRWRQSSRAGQAAQARCRVRRPIRAGRAQGAESRSGRGSDRQPAAARRQRRRRGFAPIRNSAGRRAAA